MKKTTPGKRKPKSPSAPTRNLKDSYDDVAKLYSDFSHGSFTKEEIASTLNVSSETGPFAQRLASLKAYRLLEKDGKKLKVGSAWRNMNGANKGSPEFKRNALSAIKSATIFAYLLDEFKSRLPPEATVSQRLETQKQFNKQKADVAARVFRESLQYAGVLDSKRNILPIREEGSPLQEEQSSSTEPPAPTDVLTSPSSTHLKLEIPLEQHRTIVIFYPSDLTTNEATKISKVLGAIVS